MSAVSLDPGGHGAGSVFDDYNALVRVFDIPAIEEKAGRPATNAPPLATLIAEAKPRIIFCEWVSARPTDARVAAFSFGRARGVIEGIAGALRVPIVFLTPPTWKRLANVPPGVENKDIARARAIAKWPQLSQSFSRKKDIDRAESALIGWAGLIREGSRG